MAGAVGQRAASILAVAVLPRCLSGRGGPSPRHVVVEQGLVDRAVAEGLGDQVRDEAGSAQGEELALLAGHLDDQRDFR